MTREEIDQHQRQLGSENKDFIMKFFYTPIARFLAVNEAEYKNRLIKYRISDLRKVPTKDEMLRQVYCLYSDGEIVKGYIASYSERDQIIINRAVWHGGMDRAAVQELFKKNILTHSGKNYYTRVELIPEVKSAWGDYISILEPNAYFNDPALRAENSDIVLALPGLLRQLLAEHLPKPIGYHFEPVTEPDEDFKVILTEDTIFQELPRILAYHGQGNIKYSQKGNPNQASAKKMSKSLKLMEFGEGSEFPIRSLLMAGLLSEKFKMKVITDSPEKIIGKLFAGDFDTQPTAPYMLTHLKGLSYFYHNDFTKGTTSKIFQAFRSLPPDQWISFENLQSYIIGRFLDIMPLNDWNLRNKIRAEFEDQEDSGTWVVQIHAGNKWQLVGSPYLAGHVFLLAAFGLMDIAIDPFMDNELTIYDNLYAFRLTKLGAYILGISKEYSPAERGGQTSLIFDENSPIIRIEGDVVLGDTLLNNYTTRVSENRYQFSPGKFLKECRSTKDIQIKIALFKQTVGQKLPPFWESYLQELVDNSKSISLQSKIKVFTIPAQDKVLQRIIVQDDAIKKLVIKAEQYHILISEANFPAFTNRMKELGYLVGLV